jgi:hypothetical protein
LIVELRDFLLSQHEIRTRDMPRPHGHAPTDPSKSFGVDLYEIFACLQVVEAKGALPVGDGG